MPAAFERYRRIADSALLDRLVRGRLWIGLLAFALIGIVAMQLMVLRLNAGIGATLAREAGLQRENAQLGIEAASAGGEGRVEPLAAAAGMTFAAPGSVHFVAAGPNYVEQAVAALAQPIQPAEGAPAQTSETAASGTSSGQTGSGEALSSQAGSGEAASNETASGQAASSQAGSGEAASSQAGSGEAASGQAAAGETASTGSEANQGESGQGAASQAAHG